MFGIGGPELVVIALVALVLLGPERIPPLARGLARAYREFTKVRRQVDSTLGDLRADLNLDLDDDGPQLKQPAGRRVPLDQLHTVESEAPRATQASAPPPEPLAVPEHDDYLGSADV